MGTLRKSLFLWHEEDRGFQLEAKDESSPAERARSKGSGNGLDFLTSTNQADRGSWRMVTLQKTGSEKSFSLGKMSVADLTLNT